MKNNLKQKFAIFDVDGTILDSKRRMARELVWTAEQLGIGADYNIALENYNNWNCFIDYYNIPKANFFGVEGQGKTWEQSLMEKEAILFKDTIPCLETLASRNVLLGVLTKSKPEYTWKKINYFGLKKYFGDRIVITNIKDQSKIDDAKRLVSQLNQRISSVYLIGDQLGDVIIAPEVEETFRINSNGIWLNRECSETPEILSKFPQINSLEELSKII